MFSVAEENTCDIDYTGSLPPPVCSGNYVIPSMEMNSIMPFVA